MDRTLTGIVLRVPDGDGLILRVAGVDHQIRIAWIDAPEISQSGGPNARALLRALALAREITARIISRDKWHRLVSNCTRADGLNLGLAMIQSGHARLLDRFSSPPAAFRQAADYARTHQIGPCNQPWSRDPRAHRATKTALIVRRRPKPQPPTS